jgi:hypothetical protein
MDAADVEAVATGHRLRALDDLEGLLPHPPARFLDDRRARAAEQRQLGIGGRAEDVGRRVGQLAHEERDLYAAGDGPAFRRWLSRAAPEPVFAHD